VQNIEFLPPRYRHRRHSQRTLLQKVAVLGTAAAAIASLSAWQHRQERAAREAWLQADARHAVAEAADYRLTGLRGELADARAAADLCVFLQRPWPRSHMLAAIAAVLPEDVELTELRISYEALPSDGARSAGPAPTRTKVSEDALPAPLRDLRRLRGEFDAIQTVVQISGVAREPAALHRFVSALGEEPLFTRADLGSQEAFQHPRLGGVTRFAARAMVRPEYGHPLGPVRPVRVAHSGRAGR
jgi:Tfp pilus assembly protein PilN